MNKETKVDGFLYFIQNGEITVYKGYITKSLYGGLSQFCTTGKKKSCNPEPGMVYNSTLWLTKRNDNLARKLFIKYEDACIKELQKVINNRKSVIKSLRISP